MALADEAQAADDAAIRGVVRHEKTKQPLVGALVIVECTCLQGSRETMTDASGLYAVRDLPQGPYRVTVLSGDGKVEKSFDLVRSSKLNVNFTLDPKDPHVRTIRVPSMIQTRKPSSGRITSMTDAARMPLGSSRDVADVAETAATANRVAGGVALAGGTPAEVKWSLGATSLTSPRFSTMTSGLVQDFLEEVEVLEAGYDAEYGDASTGQVRSRRISGNNKLRGTARFTFTPRVAKPRYILATDNAVRAIDVPDYQMAGALAMSGPIVKDRLFWSAGLQMSGGRASLIQGFYHRVDKDNSGGYEDCPYQNGAFDCVAGGDYIATRKFAEQKFKTSVTTPQFFVGLDWAISPKHRIELTLRGAPTFQRRAYRRAPNGNYDPAAFGTTFSTDPLGGGSLVANGVVNGSFGWDRGNSTNVGAEYHGRVAGDRIEIDGAFGYGEFVDVQAWKVDRPELRSTPLTQSTDAQGANLFALLDQENRIDLVPGVEQACNASSLPGLTCPVRQWLSGGLGPYGSSRQRRVEGALSLTHFFNAAGSHQLKYGAKAEHIEDRSVEQYSGSNAADFYGGCTERGLQGGGGEWCYDPSTNSYAIDSANRVDNHRLIRVDTDNPDNRTTRGYGRVRYEDGELRAIATPLGAGIRADAYRSRVATQNYALYLQDRWALRSNLFLSAGMRWEMQDMRDVFGRRAVFIWDNVAPRVGLSYDWTEEGRSRLYASYGWFYQPLPLQLNSRVFGGLVQVGRTYRNSDCVGHTTSTTTGDHPREIGGAPTEYCTDYNQFTTGLTPGAVVPRLRGQYNQQFQIGYEQEVIEDLTLGVRWIHNGLGRGVEDISTDGGNNFIIANPGVAVASEDINAQRRRCEQLEQELDGLNMDNDRRPEVARSLQRCEFLLDAYGKVGTMFDRPRRNYDAFSFEVRKRFARNWMVNASYTYSRLVGNTDGFVDPVTGAINLGASAQYDLPELIRNSFGALATNVPHRVRVDGYYTFDLEQAGRLTLGTTFRYQSGYPISIKAANNRYGYGAVYVLPRGAGGRVEGNYSWNLNIAYGYPIGKDLELELAVRWFNVTNAKAPLRVDENYSFENTRAVAGGDLGDLKHTKVQNAGQPTQFFQRDVVGRQGNFGVQSAFQNPTAAQIDLVLRF
ncbi:MAG: carboxypeptidase regulatory-like domain-containing protein [Nannocystaceae bacterium]|nr:carboxypeptidase regulatory-like domain-containing protein [Nannocystaceae bacterium]